MTVAMMLTVLDSTKLNSYIMLIFVPLILSLIVWAIDLVLWQIIGKEIVEITPEDITVRHRGRIFKYNKIIPVSSIKRIKNESNQIDMLRDFWFPKNQSYIKVLYNYDDSIRIGRNLTKTESVKLLDELQKSYPNVPIDAETSPHKLTPNEIMFIIWAVGSVFLFIPAWFVVPVWQEKHDKERIEKYTKRIAFIRHNYQKMYCYSNDFGSKCTKVIYMNESDSVYESIYIKQSKIYDSLIHYSKPPITILDVMPSGHSVNNNTIAGVVYLVSNRGEMSLVYTNICLFEPVFVLSRYLHTNLPECEMSDCIFDDVDKLRWDETDNFIRNGSLWKLGIVK